MMVDIKTLFAGSDTLFGEGDYDIAYISPRSQRTGLFLDQRTLKDRPRIKARLIGPPETLSVFILFPNW